jgi:hypothetical protein
MHARYPLADRENLKKRNLCNAARSLEKRQTQLPFRYSLQLDTREQLNNIARLRLVRFAYREPYADYAGLSENDRLTDTGVLAQEVHEVLPEAVTESGDIVLPNGETISNLMVVNKASTCAHCFVFLARAVAIAGSRLFVGVRCFVKAKLKSLLHNN